MALEDLLGALRRHAEVDCAAVLAQARDEAARIHREAEEQLARERGRALDSERAERRAALEVVIGNERRRARVEVFAARQRCSERVLGVARAMLPEAVGGPAYRAGLAARLTRALACVSDDPAEIRCPVALEPHVRALVADRPGTVVRAGPAAASGIRVVTADGTIEVDDTLEGRMERQGAELALIISAELRGAT
jgi:vacuolar-type H+-ATPase subunit E/Vma4